LATGSWSELKLVPEVCRIYRATANPVQVIVGETAMGREIELVEPSDRGWTIVDELLGDRGDVAGTVGGCRRPRLGQRSGRLRWPHPVLRAPTDDTVEYAGEDLRMTLADPGVRIYLGRT
jgi:hypothetical protein